MKYPVKDVADVCLAGFIMYLVEPLFQEWVRFTDSGLLAECMMGHLRKNKERWRKLRRREQDPPPPDPEQEGRGTGVP